jgi:hypothetical protein
MQSESNGYQTVFQDNRLQLALALTMLDLLLNPVGAWYLRPIILSIAALSLLVPGLLSKPGLWYVLAFCMAVRVFQDWPLSDNHAYLLGYWCLAVAIALGSERKENLLATNARLLIGLVFLFATAWKLLLSTDYSDGTFFRVTFLTDHRFSGFIQLFAGFSAEQISSMAEFLDQHVDLPATILSPVEEGDRFKLLAQMATIWNIVINALIALAFLLPKITYLPRYRDELLLIFCTVTYAIATVSGFGWLLIAMGVAQSDPQRPHIRLMYVVVFMLIIFYREVPWA